MNQEFTPSVPTDLLPGSARQARSADEAIEKLAYSIPEAVAASGIGRSLIYELIGSGELESVKVGRRRIIPATSLRAWIERLLAEQSTGSAA